MLSLGLIAASSHTLLRWSLVQHTSVTDLQAFLCMWLQRQPLSEYGFRSTACSRHAPAMSDN